MHHYSQMITGSILKEERKRKGMSQKKLAQILEVSPAYINLIENGHRPLPGQLRAPVCEVLDIEEGRLSGEEGQVIVEALSESKYFSEDHKRVLQKLSVEAPDLLEAINRINTDYRSLERSLERLTDRLSQDEYLTENIHRLLSIATSIRSTSSILNTQGGLQPNQSSKFREVLHEDSRQLSDNLRGLVDHLSNKPRVASSRMRSEQQIMKYLEDRHYYLEDFETGKLSVEDIPDWLSQNLGAEIAELGSARHLFWLFYYDITSLPKDGFLDIAENAKWSVEEINFKTPASADRVLRRIAQMSSFHKDALPGLYIMDQAGSFLLETSRLSATNLSRLTCPFWPIFNSGQALGKLHSRDLSVQSGMKIKSFAGSQFYAQDYMPEGGWIYHTMLVQPYVQQTIAPENASKNVNPNLYLAGLNCAECRKADCKARRNRAIS